MLRKSFFGHRSDVATDDARKIGVDGGVKLKWKLLKIKSQMARFMAAVISFLTFLTS
jgi:hypothetical protein